MRLNLAVLAHHLRRWRPVLVNVGAEGLDICDVRPCPLTPEALSTVRREDETLFVGAYETFAELSFAPIHALCVGGSDEARAFFEGRESRAVVLPPGAGVDETFEECLRLFRRFDSNAQLLMEAMLVGSDATTVMDICARFFDNPVFLLNEALRVVALCTTHKHLDSDLSWRETETTGYISGRLLDAMGDAGLLRELEYSKEAVLVTLDGFPRRLVANVFQAGRRTVSLCVDEAESPVSPLQVALLRRLADMVGVYLETNRRILGYLPISFVDTLRAVIAGEDVDKAELNAFLRLRGWGTGDYYRVAAFRPARTDVDLGTARFNLQSLCSSVPDAVLVEGQEDALLLVHRRADGDDESWGFGEEMAGGVLGIGASVGLGMTFRDFSLLRDEALLARSTLGLCGRDGSAPGIYRYRDYLVDHMVELCSREVDVRCLCDPAVLALDEYDRRHGTDLAGSVSAYIEAGSSIVRAARELFVHRNTLVYRLNRAREVSGLDFEGPLATTHIALSCRILLGKKRGAATEG